MNYISCQAFDIPCPFVTALSYAKAADAFTDYYSRVRFRSFATAEISLRFEVTVPRCQLIGEDFFTWVDRLEDWSDRLTVKTAPTPFRLSGMPLYSSLLFAMTSLNLSYRHDRGEVVAVEADAVFSGVSPAKGASRDRALILDDDGLHIPKVSVTANDVTLESSEFASLVAFTLTERGCSLSMAFGDATKTLSRDVLDSIIGDPDSIITVDGYGDFHIISADLVDEELKLVGSVFPVSYNRSFSKTFRTESLNFDGFTDMFGVKIGFLAWHGTELERLRALEASLGFLVDFPTKTLREVPESLSPTTDYNAYIDEDMVTERISGITWRDGVHRYTAGNVTSADYGVESVCRVDDNSIAMKYLRYARYMQNTITITAPYDPRIRQHSVISVVKNATYVPVMVEHYEIDFFANQMTVECHWV